jgi:hypothetical protein
MFVKFFVATSGDPARKYRFSRLCEFVPYGKAKHSKHQWKRTILPNNTSKMFHRRGYRSMGRFFLEFIYIIYARERDDYKPIIRMRPVDEQGLKMP